MFVRSLFFLILETPRACLVAFVRVYQKCVSPFFPPMCRFTPSCSEYFVESVRKHGVLLGSLKGIRRVLRCHPWNPGGEDPP